MCTFVVCVLRRDQHGFSPLHYACMHGHGNIVELFFLRGAKTDTLNMGGDSLLHVAAQHGKYDVVMKVRGEGCGLGEPCGECVFGVAGVAVNTPGRQLR